MKGLLYMNKREGFLKVLAKGSHVLYVVPDGDRLLAKSFLYTVQQVEAVSPRASEIIEVWRAVMPVLKAQAQINHPRAIDWWVDILDASLSPEGLAIKIRSFSDREKTYTVVYKVDGRVSCTCPDFTNRGRVCKHVVSVARHYMKRLQTLPATAAVAADRLELFTALGIENPFEAVMIEPLEMESYHNHRSALIGLWFGIEMEIPKGTSGAFRGSLERTLAFLKAKGVVSSYERDGSVNGGEVKTPPFQEDSAERILSGFLSLRATYRWLFRESSISSGLHVHCNISDLSPEEKVRAKEIFLKVGLLLQEDSSVLLKIFGRVPDLRYYKPITRDGLDDRYRWINLSGSRTIEVRLGCSQKGDIKRIFAAVKAMAEMAREYASGRIRFEDAVCRAYAGALKAAYKEVVEV